MGSSPVRERVLARQQRVRPSKLRREMAEIKTHVPTWKKAVLFSKIAGVVLFAIGLEFLTNVTIRDYLWAIVLMLLGVVVILVPVRVTVDAGSPAAGTPGMGRN